MCLQHHFPLTALDPEVYILLEQKNLPMLEGKHSAEKKITSVLGGGGSLMKSEYRAKLTMLGQANLIIHPAFKEAGGW